MDSTNSDAETREEKEWRVSTTRGTRVHVMSVRPPTVGDHGDLLFSDGTVFAAGQWAYAAQKEDEKK